MHTRRTRERREVLSADLDRFETSRALWGRDAQDDSPAQERLCQAVRDAVAAVLTEKQREVIEACYFEGLSQGEIARRLGVTQQVVQKRLFGIIRKGRAVGGAIARLRGALSPLVVSS